MALILNLFQPLRPALLQPGRFFAEGAPSYRNALLLYAILAVLAGLVVFLASALNAEELRRAATLNAAALSATQTGSAALQFQQWIPWNRLFFAPMWLCIALIGGLLRHVVVRVLGEDDANLARTQTVSFYAGTPLLLLIGGLLGVIGSFAPPAPDGTGGPGGLTVALAGLLGLAAWAWQGFVCIQGFRALYGQNTGRAILTWLAPPVIGGALCCAFGGILFAFAVMVGG